jgi:hypothetical protein
MKCLAVTSSKQRLDDLFKKISALPADGELLAHWARYLCVLVSGFIDTSVSEIYIEYASKQASPSIRNYVESRLLSLQNLNMQKIISLAGIFNSTWAEELTQSTNGERKDAIDSILNNRNKIAHGKYSGITYTSIRDWYDKAVEVIELIDKQCLK